MNVKHNQQHSNTLPQKRDFASLNITPSLHHSIIPVPVTKSRKNCRYCLNNLLIIQLNRFVEIFQKLTFSVIHPFPVGDKYRVIPIIKHVNAGFINYS